MLASYRLLSERSQVRLLPGARSHSTTIAPRGAACVANQSAKSLPHTFRTTFVRLTSCLPIFAAVHVMISRLLDIVATVRAGDPFVAENAARLKTIAWLMLVMELFHLLCGVMAAAMNAAGSHIDWSFSATGWVAVALLFVLAQVFEQGTRIRADLEAMI